MKRKGFTLVELLAVIVILAVISIITIPMIGSVIEDSRKKALEQSVYGLVEAARYYAINNDYAHVVFGENATQNPKEILDYSGEIEAEGDLYIDKDGDISLCLMNEKYYVYKNYNSGIYVGEMTDNGCIVGYDALTNKYVAMLDDGTGSISNVYSKEEINNIVNGLETKIDTNTTNINSLTSIVNNNQSNIEIIQAELSKYALQSSLDETNTTVNTNSTDIDGLQSSVNTLNSFKNKVDSFVTFHTIDIGTSSPMLTADLLNKHLPYLTSYLGGFHIVQVNGPYKNVGTLLVNGVAPQNGQAGYGSAYYMSYYTGNKTFKLVDGVWQ